MITEDFTSYAKGALSHQLARRVAAHPAFEGRDAHITYHRAEHGGMRDDSATITFSPQDTITLRDYAGADGHGVIVTVTVHGDTHTPTYYMRHTPIGIADADWRELTVNTIARNAAPAATPA